MTSAVTGGSSAAAKKGAKAIGYDLSRERPRRQGRTSRRTIVENLAKIFERDVFTLDLSGASVITLYLLPKLNVKLIPQLEKLKPGSRIVSHDFDMKGVEPDRMVQMTSGGWREPHDLSLDRAAEEGIRRGKRKLANNR